MVTRHWSAGTRIHFKANIFQQSNPMDIIDTPPLKRRKLVPAIPKVSPSKLSDLLSVFGARKSLTSVSKMDRDAGGHSLRGKAPVSYAESPPTSTETSPTNSPALGVLDSFDVSESESDSEDELTSDDVIHVSRH